MKVLYIVPGLSPEWGGTTTVIEGLTKALVRRDVEVTIFAPNEQVQKDEIIQPEGVEVRLFRKNILSKIWAGYSINLARTLNTELDCFDLIHIHGSWNYPCYAAYNAAKKVGKPYIITIHGTLEPWALNYKGLKKKIYSALIQKRILREAAALQAITEEEAKHIRAFGVDGHIAVIPNGIDLKAFRDIPSYKVSEKRYPQLKGKKVILYLGRIHPIKGLDILAKAFGKVARRVENIHLLIVGPDSGGYKRQVEKMLESEKILKKTTFTGMLIGQTKLAALRRADICVIPSYSEVRSIVALEAMICKIPVVITHQCHFPEVAKAKAGIIIDPDVEQLTIALLNLLKDAHLRKEMGANGRRLVIERFSWDKIAEQMIQLYEDILNNKE